jgi:hypothetical protein
MAANLGARNSRTIHEREIPLRQFVALQHLHDDRDRARNMPHPQHELDRPHIDPEKLRQLVARKGGPLEYLGESLGCHGRNIRMEARKMEQAARSERTCTA